MIMGRTKSPDSLHGVVHVRGTTDEVERWKSAAKVVGSSFSEFARALLNIEADRLLAEKPKGRPAKRASKKDDQGAK